VAPRYFVDETDLALGRALARTLAETLYPGHIDLPEVPRGSLDDDWLPIVGARRLVVVTRDKRIRYRPVEKSLWVQHRVRGFVLTGRRSQSTAESVAVLSRHWPKIEALAEERTEGPWMFAVTLRGLREITLAGQSGS
jgi:hypothetical protein